MTRRNRPSLKRQMRSRHSRQRQGVILLVVLGILALFALVGVVYVVTSGQHNAAVRNEIKWEQVGDPPEALLNDAVLQLLVGTRNKASALQVHSLLEDMYGNDAIRGQVPSGANLLAGPGGSLDMVFRDGVNIMPADDYSDYYTGCVLTMVGGRARGRSGLVVSYAPAGGSFNNRDMRLRVMPFPGLASHQTIQPGDVQSGDLFLINGRPFNGTGFGLSNVSANNLQPLNANEPNLLCDALDPWSRQQFGQGSAWQLALLPHPAYFRPADLNNPLEAGYALSYLDPSGPGGADEDYDAVDFQNWLLAARMSTTVGGAPRVVVPVPSLHRPEVVQYWMARAINDFSIPPNTPKTWELLARQGSTQSAKDAIKELARRSSLRPSALDHFIDLPGGSNGERDANEPDFAGRFPVGSTAGPTYDPLWAYDHDGNGNIDPAEQSAWDVDNDGDGQPDSVWVDLGFPVQRRPDGTLYKPLFAILVVDMDGKLNVNANGNLNQLVQDSQVNLDGPYAGNNLLVAAGNPVAPIPLPVGEGYGPPEVNLRVLVDLPTGAVSGRSSATSLGDIGRLMTGYWNASQNSLVPGRYGEPQSTPTFGTQFTYTLTPFPPVAGERQTGAASLLSRLGMAEHALIYFGTPEEGSHGLPPDLDGDGAMGLDLRGQPFFQTTSTTNFFGFGHGEIYESENSPYDLDLSRNAPAGDETFGGQTFASDAPFQPEELERVLRYSDIDAQSLSSRILTLAPYVFDYDPSSPATAYRRNLVTTASFDLPSPSVLPPVELVWENRDLNDPNEVGATNIFQVNQPGATRLTDMVRMRIIEENNTPSTALINNALRLLLSYESRANLKFNVNTPFGDGRDSAVGGSQKNGVVDEAEESYDNGQSQTVGVSPLADVFDANNDGAINQLDAMPGARGDFARHLYVLALLTADERFKVPGGLKPNLDETAERIAQWAINAVEYRDRDGIMTAFEYDLHPFKDDDGDPDNGTWDVDGVIGVNPVTGTSDDAQPWREVVWGCERPEVVISETFATHDRRLEDTDEEQATPPEQPATTTDPDPAKRDDDLDQKRPPEGSLWVELYNPGGTFSGDPSNGNIGRNEDAHAEMSLSVSRPQKAIDLSKLSVNGASTMPGAPAGYSPVWRLAIKGDPAGGGNFPDPDDPRTDANFSLRAGSSNYNPSVQDVDDYRFVYFIPKVTGGMVRQIVDPAAGQQEFFLKPPPNAAFATAPFSAPKVPLLLPDRYAVVGPPGTLGYPSAGGFTQAGASTRATIIGKRKDFNNSALPPYPVGSQNHTSLMATRRIELIRDPLISHDAWGQLGVLNPTNTAGALTMPTALPPQTEMKPPIAIICTDGKNRLSVSEPVAGYPVSQLNGTFATVFDDPLDDYTSNPLFTTNGNKEGFFMVHLQRLANPLQPWDPRTNPYRTIDSMPIDVFVFNGEPSTPSLPGQSDTPTGVMASRQRGDSVMKGLSSLGARARAFWLQEPVKRNYTFPAAFASDSNHVYEPQMMQTLGYVNELSTTARLNRSAATNAAGTTFGNSLEGLDSQNQGNYGYKGVRGQPAPWLAFPDRPFVSANELLNVVGTRSSRLLNPGTFTQPGPPQSVPGAPFSTISTSTRDYDVDPTKHLGAPPYPPNVSDGLLSPVSWDGPSFAHLLNFFQTRSQTGNSTGEAPQWYRMLDYLHVPSRFAGTRTYLPPGVFSVQNASYAGTHEFHPPNNWLSNYREPGKINLNTIFDEGETWKGIVGYNVSTGSELTGMPTWNEVRDSRRGDPNHGSDLQLPGVVGSNNLPLPSRFATPFRAATGANYVPVEELRLNSSANPRYKDAIETTVFRRRNATTAEPLMEFDRKAPLDGPANPNLPVNTDANPNFRNLVLQKLGNLVTTRSNVYAVWVTVGYFEVERVPSNQQFDSNGHLRYPDGYRLVREVGVDNGQIERHRAFYMIDRTIPVAFERGETHNVENCILLRRFIE